MKDWIDFGLVRDFAAEKTEAYRLCTKAGGWVERYGPDASFPTRRKSRAKKFCTSWRSGRLLANQKFERVFGRYLPKQNAERNPPVLLSGDAGAPLQRTVLERGVCFALDFGAGYSAGLFIDQRENRSHSSGTARRAGCSIVSPTPARFPSWLRWPAPRR